MLHFVTVLLIFFLNLTPCLLVLRQPRLLNLEARIIGGRVTSIEDVPWQVSLQYLGHHNCGGTLISDKWILTAAHCIYTLFLRPQHLKVRVESSQTKSGGQIYDVRRIIPHFFYNPITNDYDYALIELINSTNSTKFAKLPQLNDHLLEDSFLLISGWGLTSTNNSSKLSEPLMSVNVPVVNQTLCQTLYERIRITARMLCYVGLGEKDSCQGDSGGPAVLNQTLWGVVSWGNGCGDPKYPGVYSNVKYIRNWIRVLTRI